MTWESTEAKWTRSTKRMASDLPLPPNQRPALPEDPVPDDPAEDPPPDEIPMPPPMPDPMPDRA